MNIKDLDKTEIFDALYESVKLQSHYAAILNNYDGGSRIIFNTTYEWIERLRKIREQK